MKTVFTTVMMIAVSIAAMAMKEITIEEYIDKYKHISIEEMEKSGIPASITLAQGILESRFGNSELAVKGNNHFGIKCHKEWTGKKMYYDDDARNECFRVYRNPEESYRDHTDFLETRSRYAFIFEFESTDYKNWAKGLKKAGYATNPQYANILINLIEKHQLYLYDRPIRKQILANKHEDRNKDMTPQVTQQKDYKINHGKTSHTQANMNTNSAAMEVFSFNRIKAVKVGATDNLNIIAERHDVAQNRLMKYNDLTPGEQLTEGQFVYLQPKRGKAVHREHIVQTGQTMKDISQLHGVKLEKLYQRNLLAHGEEPANGQVIYLNKKRDKKPVLKSREELKQMNEPVVKQPSDKEKQALQEVFEKTEAAMKKAEEEAKKKEEARLAEEARKAEEIRKQAEAVVAQQKALEEKEKQESLKDLEPVAIPRNPPVETTKEVVNETKSTIEEKATTFITHKVVKGDTLYNLSKRYNVTVDDLKKWNKLTSNNINLGQILQVKQ